LIILIIICDQYKLSSLLYSFPEISIISFLLGLNSLLSTRFSNTSLSVETCVNFQDLNLHQQ
jgi:hypothetical protein